MAQYEGGSGDTRYRIFATGVHRQLPHRRRHSRRRLSHRPHRLLRQLRHRRSRRVAAGRRRAALFARRRHHAQERPHHDRQPDLSAVVRPLRLRENFTGFLLDTQNALQPPHGQRGDEIDMNMLMGTVGLKGSARLAGDDPPPATRGRDWLLCARRLRLGDAAAHRSGDGRALSNRRRSKLQPRRRRPLWRLEPAPGQVAGRARRRARRRLHLRRARQLRGAIDRASQSQPAALRTELFQRKRTSATIARPTSRPRRCRRRTCRAARSSSARSRV